jgi:hypothetical protein
MVSAGGHGAMKFRSEVEPTHFSKPLKIEEIARRSDIKSQQIWDKYYTEAANDDDENMML